MMFLCRIITVPFSPHFISPPESDNTSNHVFYGAAADKMTERDAICILEILSRRTSLTNNRNCF